MPELPLVLLVSRSALPTVGGMERQMYAVAAETGQRGSPVEFITRARSAEVPYGVQVRLCPRIVTTMPLYLLWLAVRLLTSRLAYRHRPTSIVVAHVSGEAAVAALMGVVLRAGVIVYYDSAGPGISELAAQRRRWVVRLMRDQVDVLVSHCSHYLDDAVKLGCRGRPVRIPTIQAAEVTRCAWTPPGTDGTGSTPSDRASRVVWCGRNVESKRLERLRPLVAAGLTGSGAVILVITDQPPTVAIPRAWVHLGCPSPRSHQTGALAHLLTSDYEGQSNALAEAAMEGTPTVAFATGGTPEAVADVDGGVVVPPGATDAEVVTAVRAVAARFAASSEREALRRRAHQRYVVEAPALWVDTITSASRGGPRCHGAPGPG